MESEIYETDDDYTYNQMKEFIDWFDKEIGTESERSESASGEPNQYYCMFFDLIPKEVVQVSNKELELRKQYKKDSK